MLISFSVENFISFKEEATLSMVAGKGKEMREPHTFTPTMKNGVKTFDLLSSAVIYGPNAGGKTSFFRAFLTMEMIVHGSIKGFQMLPIVPFMLSDKTKTSPSVFEIEMVIDGVRYQYGFSATSERIHAEWLFAFPKGRTQTWFERDYNKKTNKYDYNFSDALKGQKEVWRETTNPKALFLSIAVHFNSTQLKPIYDWFAENTMLIDIHGITQDISIMHCNELGNGKIISFLKAADFAIEDIEVEEVSFPKQSSTSIINPLNSLSSDEKKEKSFQVRTIHKTQEGGYIRMPLDMESEGTQRMFALAAPLLHILENGIILFADELNQHLHPHLMQYLIELFNNPKTNPNNAQLIFTTHAVSLLKKDIFRRDQIWFCERDANQATTLFPLTDFKPRKGHEDFETYYMSGRYGALPIIGEFSDFAPKEASK